MRPRRRHDRESTCGVPYPGTKLPRELWIRTRVGLGPPRQVFDWTAAFGREAPRVLDLGCGNGRFVVRSALARRDHDHLGIDLVPVAIRLGSLRAGQRGLTNAKFAWGDATEFLFERCPSASVAEVHLYHPQPYHERHQHDDGFVARRQLAPEVLYAVHRRLTPGGLFVVQTDNPAYAEYARAILPALFELREHPEPWEDAPQGRTLREIVARQQGLPIVRLIGTRLELGAEEAEARARALPLPTFEATPQPWVGQRAQRPAPRPSGKRSGWRSALKPDPNA